MFTFGRDQEKICAGHYLSNQKQVDLIGAVIDAVHDLLEDKISKEALRPVLEQGFTEGGSGVWEQTGIWLRKLSDEFPEFATMWIDFADHSQSTVRFRAACCLDEMPPHIARAVNEKLMHDGSKNVRSITDKNAA
jgi:hypothetical protein